MRLSLIFILILVTLSKKTLPEACAADAATTKQPSAAKYSPPVAKKIPKEIITHGDKRIDDYFWLRDKTNSEVIAYLEAENTYSDASMQTLQNFKGELYREMLSHLKETDSSAPVRRGEFFYYTRTEEGKNYPIHCRKHGSLSAPEEVILDQNALAEGHKFFSVGVAIPSDDNHLLAYSTDTTGYRQFTLQIKDLRTGELLPEKFERVDDVVWSTDNKTLFFVTENEQAEHRNKIFSGQSAGGGFAHGPAARA